MNRDSSESPVFHLSSRGVEMGILDLPAMAKFRNTNVIPIRCLSVHFPSSHVHFQANVSLVCVTLPMDNACWRVARASEYLHREGERNMDSHTQIKTLATQPCDALYKWRLLTLLKGKERCFSVA
jgi:hypothetical protein